MPSSPQRAAARRETPELNAETRALVGRPHDWIAQLVLLEIADAVAEELSGNHLSYGDMIRRAEAGAEYIRDRLTSEEYPHV